MKKTVIILSVLFSQSIFAQSVPAYLAGTKYIAGDRVTRNAKLFECKSYPYSGWCSSSAYVPGTTLGAQAWTDLGNYSTTTTSTTVVNPFAGYTPVNDMAGSSSTALPTQSALKSYILTLITDAIAPLNQAIASLRASIANQSSTSSSSLNIENDLYMEVIPGLGNGSTIFNTLKEALDFVALKRIKGGTQVGIELAQDYEMTEDIYFNHPDGEKIVIRGGRVLMHQFAFRAAWGNRMRMYGMELIGDNSSFTGCIDLFNNAYAILESMTFRHCRRAIVADKGSKVTGELTLRDNVEGIVASGRSDILLDNINVSGSGLFTISASGMSTVVVSQGTITMGSHESNIFYLRDGSRVNFPGQITFSDRSKVTNIFPNQAAYDLSFLQANY